MIERASISETLSQSIPDVCLFLVSLTMLPERGPFKIVGLAFDIIDPANRTYAVPCVLNLFSLQVRKQHYNSMRFG